MNKKILVTGSSGFVGKNLYQLLKNDFDILGIGKSKSKFVDRVIDICDAQLMIRVLEEFNPDEIVHLAAFSNVERCEYERELTEKSNVLSVKILAGWADKNDKRITFASTDYVFDGGKGNFSEDDIENPLQYYGHTKLIGEKIIASLKKFIILRPTVIYGWDPKGMNFLMQLYRNQMEKKAMRVPTDQISNPTFVLDLCKLIRKIINSGIVGKFIATGNESLSRYDFAIKICDYMGWNKDFILPVETKSLGQMAKRPLNNSTSNQQVTNSFDFNFNSLENNLGIIRSQIINYDCRIYVG